ncbi:MAG: 30S ribosomal protein S8 [Chloroflexia bacterium]|nr:30S ribosomal protein S8 [Chloroflexia bacterium]
MTLTDPIADMLTRIRNALMARHEEAVLPSSQVKEEIARILRKEGYLYAYETFQEGPRRMLRLTLKYDSDDAPMLAGLKRVSKPGQRIYTGRDQIPRIRGGLGFAILSTSKGIMTGEDAWRAGVGGEVLCYIW